MVIAFLTFQGGFWLWAGVLLAFLGAVSAIAGYRRRGNGRIRRDSWAPLLLRMIALALLAFALAEPAWVRQEAEPGANMFAIVADTSAGMQIRDSGETKSRGEVLQEILAESDEVEAKWVEKLGETFSLRRFTFDSNLRRRGLFDDLEFKGNASSIGKSLESIGRRFAGRPLAGVFLLSDGNATDRVDLSGLKNLPPVYPVIIGKKAPERDLGIVDVRISQTSFEDSPVTIQADLAVHGYAEKDVTIRLVDGKGEIVEEQRLRPSSNNEKPSIRFLHRPPTGGVHFLKLEISAESGEEATMANNARHLTIDRGTGPYRVLYVSGRPNWEFKFLNRALATDDEVDLIGLIRVAKREPKFQWRGREGESANPLFRGFNPDDDTAEYDQPVLVRLNTRDDRELASGFPRSAVDLFEYDAVILDDLERAFFTIEQMELLENFVAKRGGSLLMAGGAESFAHGNYDRTPVAKLLPVHLGRPVEATPVGEFAFDLSRDGWLSPWVRLRQTESDERSRIASMSSFKSLNRIAGIKPGATVLAHVDDEGAKRPALVAQKFGRGRVSALLIADFWRWGFNEPDNREDMEKAWRQTIRWLIADVPERVELELESAGDGAVKAIVRVRDKEFDPVADARVSVTVEGGVGEDGDAGVEIPAMPSDTEPGVYEVTFLLEKEGSELVQAEAVDGEGISIGKAEKGWVSNPAADEFRKLDPNPELMGSIAKATGGKKVEPAELAGFAAKLPKMEAPETRTVATSLWHTPWVFLMVIGCFGVEWALRRKRGMA